MPHFKPKAKKKIRNLNKNTVTLDCKHNEKMQEFKRISNIEIPRLIKEKLDIKEELKNHCSIERKMELQDQLKDLKNKIKTIKNKKKIIY